MSKDEKINGIDKWEVKDAMHTLQRAEELKGDKKMMAAIAILAKEHIEHAKSIGKIAEKESK
jgi:hypothetical protein